VPPDGQPPRFVEWERDLRARLMAGDPLALAEAYDQFSPMVYGLAARVTGDRAAAEDVTQKVFLRQVARLTGVPEGTAKSRLRLGLRRIADRLQSEGLGGEW
jgi:DNA-directed RNA polymerase specialized sigma24 family protein